MATNHVHNGHNGQTSRHAAASPKNATGRAHPRASGAGDLIGRVGRELPRRIEAQMRSNPVAVIATVGAFAFTLGAVLGSRLGRVALAAALPLTIQRIFEGAFGEKLGELTRRLTEDEGEREPGA